MDQVEALPRAAKRSEMSLEEYEATHDARARIVGTAAPWAWAKATLAQADEAVRREHARQGAGLLYLVQVVGWFNRDAIGKARWQSAIRRPRGG